MILVKEQKLHFLDSKSDKVYEVELFHIQQDEYVVNFRYGRRGNNLNEGTKTVFPVSKNAAEKIYDDLIESKIIKGYRKVLFYTNDNPIAITQDTAEADPAADTLIDYLNQHANGVRPKSNWSLSRMIWRAGELKLNESFNAISKLLPTLSGQERYSAIWFLGRLNSTQSYELLKNISVQEKDLWRRIYIAALVRHGNEQTIEQMVNSLPAGLKTLYLNKNITGYFEQLDQLIFELDSRRPDFILTTYYLSIVNLEFKAHIISLIHKLTMRPNRWKYLRYIYKIAEMLDDGEIMGVLSAKIQGAKPFYHSSSWRKIYIQGKYVDELEELARNDSSLAFSQRTRDYFIRRTLRRLTKSGTDGKEYYCELAANILISYSEADRLYHPDEFQYLLDPTSGRYTRQKLEFSSLSHIPYLFHILYGNGQRFQINGISRYRYSNEATDQSVREDNYPQLWDNYPSHAIRLVSQGRLTEVVDFGLRVLKERTDLVSLVSADDLKRMLTQPYDEAVDFALNLVKESYDATSPNVDLIIALIDSSQSRAIDLAVQLINKNETVFYTHKSFVQRAIISSHEQLHQWLRINISERNFSTDDNNDIIESTLQFYTSSNTFTLFHQSVDSLVHCFKENLSRLDLQTLTKLFDQDNIQLHLLAGKLINVSQVNASDLPYDLIMKMINSPHSEVRAQGINLLEKLTNEELLQKERLVFNLATSPQADLRHRAKDLIDRLAVGNDTYRDSLFLELYPLLLENQEDETFHADIYDTIKSHLSASIPLILPNIEQVLKDDHRETHLMTEYFLSNQTDLNNWPLEMIALMGNHDMKAVRAIAFNYYNQNIDRIKYEKDEALKILDSTWEETRAFGFNYFDTNFSADEWSPLLIISLCDNVRPEIQSYGTKILGRYFKDENGIKYLTALSEHPDPTIQLYTTNYLSRYASNNMELLMKLEPYFRTVLTSICKNRSAKERVYKFLSVQATIDESFAQYVAKIINDIVPTIAVGDKQKCILLLHQIQHTYPSIDVRLTRTIVEART